MGSGPVARVCRGDETPCRVDEFAARAVTEQVRRQRDVLGEAAAAGVPAIPAGGPMKPTFTMPAALVLVSVPVPRPGRGTAPSAAVEREDQYRPLYACQPVAILVRGPNDPLPSPELRHTLPAVSRETMSALASPVMSPMPMTAL